MQVHMCVAAFRCKPYKICGTGAKIFQLNEWGCRDGMHHARNHGNKEIPLAIQWVLLNVIPLVIEENKILGGLL